MGKSNDIDDLAREMANLILSDYDEKNPGKLLYEENKNKYLLYDFLYVVLSVLVIIKIGTRSGGSIWLFWGIIFGWIFSLFILKGFKEEHRQYIKIYENYIKIRGFKTWLTKVGSEIYLSSTDDKIMKKEMKCGTDGYVYSFCGNQMIFAFSNQGDYAISILGMNNQMIEETLRKMSKRPGAPVHRRKN